MFRGKQKKLQNLAERKSSQPSTYKTSFLQEHSTKIEQKLAYLKQKISEKKKTSVNQKKNGPASSELSSFITRLGLGEYLPCLQQHGIDSYQVLKQVKQSQLQEIGIAKGHALKIAVHIKKEQEKYRKKSLNEKSKVESTLDESGIKKIENNPSKPVKKQLPQICQIQTQSIPLEHHKRQFCLYCFSRSQTNFCSNNCESLYNCMFERYENNLQKAEDNFIQKKQEKELQKEQELSDNQEFMQSFDFLFSPQLQDFAMEEYQKIKEIMKK